MGSTILLLFFMQNMTTTDRRQPGQVEHEIDLTWEPTRPTSSEPWLFQHPTWEET
ncbi:MAG: hypothetical protein ACK4RK_10790 [Gemmataceae bacterium]